MSDKSQEKINELFSRFQIPKENIPSYESPEIFAARFKECSAFESGEISYSNSTCQDDNPRC